MVKLASFILAFMLGFAGVHVNADSAKPKPRGNQSVTTLIGMSAPEALWNQELARVETPTGKVMARRLFGKLPSYTSKVEIAGAEVAAGRMPVLSFKLPGNDWAGAADGIYDDTLNALRDDLADIPGRVAVAIHHEPAGDGSAEDFVAMQLHVLPILGAPDNVDAGVIGNGWWWSPYAMGYSDDEIAAWFPQSVLDVAEFIASDTYHNGTFAVPGRDTPGGKIRKMSEWASRVGVTNLGLGEFNALTGAAITDACAAIGEDARYQWALMWNSNASGNDWLLSGDRLTAFQGCLEHFGAAEFDPTETLTEIRALLSDGKLDTLVGDLDKSLAQGGELPNQWAGPW